MIDIHAHILPGIDDGARTLTDSADLVRELVASGVTAIVATPHFVPETNYVSPKKENTKLLKELKRAISNEGLDVELYLGNEIYIDRNIEGLMKHGKISMMAGSDYLLVELPLSGEFPNYRDIMLDLMEAGRRVILAHPERYEIAQKDFGVLEELHKMGVLFQCNLCSVTGKYGRGAKKVLKKLLEQKMVFGFGSDIHHCHGADYWLAAQKKMTKYCDEKELNRLLVANPRKIIGK